MEKKWLVEDFCPVDKFSCLMPVAYESVEKDGIIEKYVRSRMVCRHALSGECDKNETCTFFQKAPEELEKDAKWYEG